MSSSYTYSETTTFTLTHAKYLAAKVATDLKRLQRFYGMPSDSAIMDFEAEITELLRGGYLEKVTFGYKRNGSWIAPTLIYTAYDFISTSIIDDDPGRIQPGADVTDASFGSFLIYSTAWHNLSQAERDAINKKIPVKRSTGTEPAVNGYLSKDRTYWSGGRALDRAIVRSY